VHTQLVAENAPPPLVRNAVFGLLVRRSLTGESQCFNC